jgi:hypothetical protein
MLDVVQPKNDDSNENDNHMMIYLMRIMPETDLLFQCLMNQMSQLLNGLTTTPY